MVKAHSLLYAIYICLIVSLLCGALLYIANMYNQLNIYYTTHEELYIQNQSLVNYALANPNKKTIEIEEEQTVGSSYELKPYGLLTVLTAKSFVANDTVTSVHFAAASTNDKLCVFLTNLDRSLSYSGDVKLIGDKKLPSDFIKPIYILPQKYFVNFIFHNLMQKSNNLYHFLCHILTENIFLLFRGFKTRDF